MMKRSVDLIHYRRGRDHPYAFRVGTICDKYCARIHFSVVLCMPSIASLFSKFMKGRNVDLIHSRRGWHHLHAFSVTTNL